MTIQDIEAAIKVELDKSTLSGFVDFTDDEMDYFVNRAYIMLINQKVTGHNELSSGFEDNMKRMADLRNLIITTSISGNKSPSNIKNEFVFSTSSVSDLLFPINHHVEFETILNKSETRTSVLVKHLGINSYKQSDINNPWLPEPILVMENDKIVAYVDSEDVLRYKNTANIYLTYIKRPARLQRWIYDLSGNKIENLSLDATRIPEIDEHVHLEIVSQAVDLMLDNIESNRIQSHPNITKISE